MEELKKGDKIIWDSHFGYEIGYFIDVNPNMYYSYRVNMVTGIVQSKCSYTKSEIKLHTPESIKEMELKYGYLKEF